MDVTHIPCGADGWAHLTTVIDCHDREVIGYEFALRGRAKEAERALGYSHRAVLEPSQRALWPEQDTLCTPACVTRRAAMPRK